MPSSACSLTSVQQDATAVSVTEGDTSCLLGAHSWGSCAQLGNEFAGLPVRESVGQTSRSRASRRRNRVLMGDSGGLRVGEIPSDYS